MQSGKCTSSKKPNTHVKPLQDDVTYIGHVQQLLKLPLLGFMDYLQQIFNVHIVQMHALFEI